MRSLLLSLPRRQPHPLIHRRITVMAMATVTVTVTEGEIHPPIRLLRIHRQQRPSRAVNLSLRRFQEGYTCGPLFVLYRALALPVLLATPTAANTEASSGEG